jgi:diguanylate cyclase (GGDEF)-like protein
MFGVSAVKTSDSLEAAAELTEARLGDSLIRSLWWLMLGSELVFLTIYLLSPFVNAWGNPGLWRVGGVFLWTASCRLIFWKRPILGASIVLIGIMLALPVLSQEEGELFSSAFARLTILSLPALFLSFLWGWRGAIASALSSLPILALSENTFSEDALIGFLLLLTTILCGAYIHYLLMNMQRVQLELKHMAMRDALTKLGNRYALEADFQPLRGSGYLSMWDVNGLKRVNDQHGHHAGDQYLLQFVQVYSSVTTDQLYRVGGDEFVGLHSSSSTMQSLREAVLRGFPSVSSGWTEIADRDLDACLREADAVMYRDKNRRSTDLASLVATATSVRDASETQSLEPNRLPVALEED